MDELDFYQGTHTGGEIDRDLDFIDGFINAPAPEITVSAFVPVSLSENGQSPSSYYVVNREFGTVWPDATAATDYLATRNDVHGVYLKWRRSAIVKVSFTNVSSLPVTCQVMPTMSDPEITDDMELIHSVLSNPAAQVGNWTVTTATRSVTVDGSISGTTDITLYIAKPRGEYSPLV